MKWAKTLQMHILQIHVVIFYFPTMIWTKIYFANQEQKECQFQSISGLREGKDIVVVGLKNLHAILYQHYFPLKKLPEPVVAIITNQVN